MTLRPFRTLAVALLATAAGLGAAKATTTIGNDVISRSSNDAFANFSAYFTDLVLPAGTLTSFSYLGRKTGTIALLVFSETESGDWVAEGVFDATIGERDTVETTTIPSGFAVEAGWILGLYQGSGKVDYSQFAGFPRNMTYAANNSGKPGVGDPLPGVSRLTIGRDYSISARVEPSVVPLPPALPALASSVCALALLRRRARR